MTRYGLNLKQIFLSDNKVWSKFSVLAVGLQLIDIYASIHEAGFTFNDLKLDNILLDFESIPVQGPNIFLG